MLSPTGDRQEREVAQEHQHSGHPPHSLERRSRRRRDGHGEVLPRTRRFALIPDDLRSRRIRSVGDRSLVRIRRRKAAARVVATEHRCHDERRAAPNRDGRRRRAARRPSARVRRATRSPRRLPRTQVRSRPGDRSSTTTASDVAPWRAGATGHADRNTARTSQRRQRPSL
jgi:hypothetical protein